MAKTTCSCKLLFMHYSLCTVPSAQGHGIISSALLHIGTSTSSLQITLADTQKKQLLLKAESLRKAVILLKLIDCCKRKLYLLSPRLQAQTCWTLYHQAAVMRQRILTRLYLICINHTAAPLTWVRVQSHHRTAIHHLRWEYYIIKLI